MAAAPKVQQAVPVGSDRRQDERVALEVAVGFETDHNFYTGLTQDISEGGLFVATHQLRRVGERMRIRFTLPGRPQPIEAEVEVCWIREATPGRTIDGADGMGLRFLEVPEDARAAISGFLKKRDSLFFDM